MVKVEGPLQGQGESILAADDSPTTLQVLDQLLSQAGYRVRTASSGEQALQLARASPPDLVLMDVRMPGMDGYQVCRILKAEPATAATPVIFITGDVDLESRIAGFRAGAADHLGKPFDRNELLARIGVHVALLRAGRQAEARAQALARSNEELGRFAYVVSHDLQEPLRMMSSYATLLGRRYRGRLDADADEFIGYMVDGAARMKALIDEILAYSRVGTRGLKLQPVPAAAPLEAALANLKVQLEEASARVEADALPEVVADPTQLAQVFQNLIGNAIKFRSAAPPLIRVWAARQGDRWRLAVGDNGLGIPAGELERVFEVFQRLHSKEAYPGHGVGLAVCKKVVERHGGSIWAESGPGQGTTVHFTLAAVPSAEAP